MLRSFKLPQPNTCSFGCKLTKNTVVKFGEKIYRVREITNMTSKTNCRSFVISNDKCFMPIDKKRTSDLDDDIYKREDSQLCESLSLRVVFESTFDKHETKVAVLNPRTVVTIVILYVYKGTDK